jgi:hypothetical protein
MTDTPETNFDAATIEAMNAKAVENQFFTPDHVYIDLSLLKDYPLGIAFTDIIQHRNAEHFESFQRSLMDVIHDYQKRTYDTVDPYLGSLGYTDETLADLLKNNLDHDQVFMVSPATHFFHTLIRHTIRNQNNSGPANKFTKQAVDKQSYALKALPVTYYLNTFPLTLSHELMERIGPELGESFGVDIKFINKDPSLFDEKDWNSWLSKIECYYLNSLGTFTGNAMIMGIQGEMGLAGVYIFARKRFEKEVMSAMANHDFEQQIQLITSRVSMMCDFEWLQNNEVRLTDDAEHVPVEDTPEQDHGIKS